jgi:hypothetical protein
MMAPIDNRKALEEVVSSHARGLGDQNIFLSKFFIFLSTQLTNVAFAWSH